LNPPIETTDILYILQVYLKLQLPTVIDFTSNVTMPGYLYRHPKVSVMKHQIILYYKLC